MKLHNNFRFHLDTEIAKLCEDKPTTYHAARDSRGFQVSWDRHREHFGYLEAMYAVQRGDWRVL